MAKLSDLSLTKLYRMRRAARTTTYGQDVLPILDRAIAAKRRAKRVKESTAAQTTQEGSCGARSSRTKKR